MDNKWKTTQGIHHVHDASNVPLSLVYNTSRAGDEGVVWYTRLMYDCSVLQSILADLPLEI